jgi:formate/nitrite transporter FocA (FNT family)
MAPVLVGNIVGGGALVAMLNHAQVRGEVPAVAEADERLAE